MTLSNLRVKRAAAGIAGQIVCQMAGIARSRFSDIEREYVTPTAEELQRIDAAIEEIICTRQHLEKLAAEAGLSLKGILI
jgi:transcriptional regulator with XRE-family HTH domain